MAELTEISRVTVIAETALEKTLIDEFLKLGAKGYTTINCFGKGRHEVMEDPYTGRSLVQIEVLARPPVAEAILEYVHKSQFKSYPVIGYMDTVKVHAHDTFF
jgi:nitrogen regulatory protein PII